ncbi:ankyrin repeat domain-containing protein [Klenkia brasiliensis]|uniref:Ankyrin repeat-containing protein n=1 Tax=Klenkia brasiliensis TaxID=333142 RepID=A0A1G7WIU7_9ACTN|nr:ankyrin repeat domain-containing protein [Klenkia brasiliensis]SDG71774.1 Ankyrin repeat-containing protein [Klenkia brasiliensis]
MPEQTPPSGPSTGELRALRMTAQRLAGLVAARDADAVGAAVRAQPRLLTTTVEHVGDDWPPLHLAVATGDLDLVDVLLAAGAPLEATSAHGRTPLHVALEFAPHLVDPLMERGAEPDGAAAAYLGDSARLAARLDSGASAVRDDADVSLLGWAALGGSVDAVRLLLDRGADPDDGALRMAAGAAHPEVVALLLDAGATVGRRDADTGRTALHAAVDAPPGDARLTVVRALLAAGADVESTTSDGASAVDIARVAAARDRAGDDARSAAHDDLVALLESAAVAH